MHADFSVELGHDDPVLEIPWASDDGSIRYYDLKKYPELIQQIPEAVAYPEIKAFLTRINAPGSPLETAKCDAWQSQEITPEEEIFGSDQKFVSYIDLIFVDEAIRSSFEKHEEFAKELCRLLSRAPDIAATIELIIRRCYYQRPQTDRLKESDQNSKEAEDAVMDPQATAFEPEISVSQKTSANREISVSQETSRDVESGQYRDYRPRVHTNHTEVASRLEPSDQQDPTMSLTPAMSFTQATSFTPATSLTPPNAQNPEALNQISSSDLTNSDKAYPLDGPSGPICVPNASASNSDASLNKFASTDVTNALLNKSHTPLNEPNGSGAGFYLTAYVTGFSDSDQEPRSQWAIAISLLQHALMQLNHV
jgi:hypothetical protein